jgi:proteasome accessory factor C
VTDAIADEVPALRSALAKVRAALGVPDDVADVLADQPTALLSVLREALVGGRRLELTYRGRGDDQPRRRHVDPWGLHVEDGRWYLQGYDDDAGDARVFRLDRILDAAALDEPIAVDAPETLPVPRYQPAAGDEVVEIEIGAGARWLEEAIEIDDLDELDDGRALVRFRTGAPGWVVDLVLAAAGAARVRTPERLRARVASQARAALDAMDSHPALEGP